MDNGLMVLIYDLIAILKNTFEFLSTLLNG